ncbi:MAG: dTDP-4-dehydrorhamnose reductase [Gemmiger sp.]|uniref:dTDP-4-dehydrorhamnose reductase n=1 Tax=Gemmiger sp. TaxID=2049027 RepID=UPI002E7772D3|nr:dTDP-4-dehydrorhamnose reductase [Gemmiger sp.]MEE0800563.1 dTDP-4-dehydrorhamnose reductase [Gemmiger sp.]
MKKIWISGANGHIGTALCTRLSTEKYQLIPNDVQQVDITDADAVNDFARRERPDVIINCTGFNDEDGCEANPDRAYRVNAVAPRNLARAAEELGAKLVQMSTDDVFAQPRDYPYHEFDTPCPTTVYGLSKLAGETFVRQLCRNYVIVRSAWVYGIGRDFVSEVLACANDPACPWLAVATDRVASPTSADDLAAAVEQLIDRPALGVYHVVCQGHCSRYDFAREILRDAGLEDRLTLHPVRSADAGGVPCYTVLDNMMLRLDKIPQPRPWRTALREYIRTLG